MHESWRTFASNTTLHGLRYVFGVSSWLRRVLWTFCLLAAIGYHIYLVCLKILTFTDLPIGTRIKHELPKKGISFPAVTICNLNPWAKFKLDLGYDDKRFKTYGLDIPACDVVRNISGNLTCGQALMCVSNEFGQDAIDNCTSEIKETLTNALQKSRSFNQEEFMLRFGLNFETMLIGPCEFSLTTRCTAKDFLPIITSKGLCYTFNNRFNASKKRVQLPGDEGGLRLVINTQAPESTFGGRSVGLQVIIHEQSSVVDLNRGFHVYPGTNVMALIFAKMNFRLEEPYITACSKRHLGEFGHYTRHGCVSKCLNDALIKDCRCRSIGSPGPKEFLACSFLDEKCFSKVLDDWNPNNCSCPLACRDVRYDVTTSFSKYPSETLIRVLSRSFKVNLSEEHLRNNLVHLRIGFVDRAYQIFRDYPSYEKDKLISDIGGSMGLLLGCSLLTVVEFFDYFCVAIFNFVCTKKSSQNIGVTNEPANNQSIETE